MWAMRHQRVERRPDELSCSLWLFWYNDSDHTLVLSAYEEYQRSTKRHKLRLVRKWGHLQRSCERAIELKDIPCPPDVVAQARDDFMRELHITNAMGQDVKP